MSYTAHFHPLVQKDYIEGYNWYEEKQKGLGERFLKTVRLKIEEIALHPHVHGSRSHKIFREAQVEFFPYLIVFKIHEKTKEVFIASIHNTKKNPNKKFRS